MNDVEQCVRTRSNDGRKDKLVAQRRRGSLGWGVWRGVHKGVRASGVRDERIEGGVRVIGEHELRKVGIRECESRGTSIA